MFVLYRNYFHILINDSTAHVNFTMADVDFVNSGGKRNSVSDEIMCPHPFKILFNEAVFHMHSYYPN